MSEPAATVDQRYSAPGAMAVPWERARSEMDGAGVYWLSTVRPDGRPHVTTIAAVWLDDALYFSTGPEERKARNLAANQHCVVTTGRNSFTEGLDVVIEGVAEPVQDDPTLQRLADQYAVKYDNFFEMSVADGGFTAPAGPSRVYRVVARQAFGFRKGDEFSQTRWRF